MSSTRNRRWYVYGPDRGPLGGTMEAVAAALEPLDGSLFEWDGSFSWADPSAGWQLHGMLYDDPAGLHYVDLHARWKALANSIDVRNAFLTLLILFRPGDPKTVANRPDPGPWNVNPDPSSAGPTGDSNSVMLLQLPQQIWQIPAEISFGQE